MSLLKNVLGVKHDGVDSRHLLKNHQHDANGQRLVDAAVHQVRQLESGALAAGRQAITHRSVSVSETAFSDHSNTHHFVTGVFDAGTFVLDGRVRPSQEAQGLLGLSPLALGQQEARRLGHKAHADHEQRGRDGAADRQPAPVQEKTCRERLQDLSASVFVLPFHLS